MQVTATGSTSGGEAALSFPAQELSPNQFLNLLIAQLKNQDPLNPMDQTQFIGELAQLQSVSEMRQINQQLGASAQYQSRATALEMLGRTVEWQDAQGTLHSGKVEAVVLGDNHAAVRVGDSEVDMRDVRQVAGE